MNCILAIPFLLETGCAEFCFRTFSLVQENGFVPEKYAAGIEIHFPGGLDPNWATEMPVTDLAAMSVPQRFQASE